MKRWRQFLALSLALLLLLPALANLTPAQADEVEEKYYNGFTYMVRTDNTSQLGTYVRLCKYEGTETDLVIPEEIDGVPVKVVDLYKVVPNDTTKTVTISKNVIDFKNYSFHQWTALEAIYVVPENEVYESRNGVLCRIGSNGMAFYPEGKKDSSLTMNSRYGPGPCDFWNPYLEEVIIGYTGGDPLPTAPEWFNLPNLKRFVTQDGDDARYTIDGILYADFSNSDKTLIRYPAGKYTGGVLQVPEGTTAFYPYALSKMYNLTAVYIPASVTWIGCAFYGSTNLKDIYYGGNEEAWKKVGFSIPGADTSNITVHFNSTGPISDGWHQEDGKWFYYENGSHITGWKRLPDSHRYYFDETGVLQHGWLLDNGNWYYLNASGFVVTGWQKLPDGNWYYFNGSGVLQHNWVRYSGNWYYLNASGFMVTGWQRLPDGNWYYFDGSGVMQTGWLNRGGNWYYLNSSGIMQTGWQYIGGSWYYFYPGGNMASSTTLTLGGTRYTFDASGRWVV